MATTDTLTGPLLPSSPWVGDNKARLSALLLIGLWLMLFTAVVGGLLWTYQPPARTGEILGQVAIVHGQVDIRPRRSLLWTGAAVRQDLVAGDLVATGDRSATTVALKNGKTLELGPNSMVGIDDALIGGSAGSAFSLTLLKGHLKAAGSGELNVRSEGKAFHVSNAGTLNLTKEKHEEKPATAASKSAADTMPASLPAPHIEIPKGFFVLAPTPTSPIATPLKTAAPAVAGPPPTLPLAPKIAHQLPPTLAALDPAPPAPVIPQAEDFLASVATKQPLSLFIGASLRGPCPLKDLKIAMTPPVGKGTLPHAWAPLLSIGGDAGEVVRGVSAEGTQWLKVSGGQLCSLMPTERTAQPVSFDLTPGAEVDTPDNRAFSDMTKSLRIQSLADLPERPVSVHFRTLDVASAGPTTWLPALAGQSSRPLHLHLARASLLPLLVPLFAANGGVAMDDSPPGSGVVVNFVAGDQIIATLAGALDYSKGLRKLCQRLGADFGFIGPREAMVRLPLAQLNRLSAVGQLLESHDAIQLLHRNRMVRVTADDATNDGRLVTSLVFSSRFAFTQDVKLIAP